jgi:hypothetical protein
VYWRLSCSLTALFPSLIWLVGSIEEELGANAIYAGDNFRFGVKLL